MDGLLVVLFQLQEELVSDAWTGEADTSSRLSADGNRGARQASSHWREPGPVR